MNRKPQCLLSSAPGASLSHIKCADTHEIVTRNTHKMPPDQAQAMKSFPPQTQPGSFIKTGNNYPCLKPLWLHVFVVRQA